MIWATHDAGGGTVYSELRVNMDGTVVCQVGPNNSYFSIQCVFLTEA